MSDRAIVEAAKALARREGIVKKMLKATRKIVRLEVEYLKLAYGHRFSEEALGEAVGVWNVVGMTAAQVYLAALSRTGDPLEAHAAVASMFSDFGRALLAEKFRALLDLMELEEHFRKRGVEDGG